MPELHERQNAASVDDVLAEFAAISGHLADLGRETQILVEKLLASERLKVHSVQHRVKSRDKLKAKYPDSTKDYLKLTDITDLVGLRIITYYEDEIDAVAELIEGQFSLDPKCNDRRVANADSFGYSALHLICSYSESRLAHTEYKAYAGNCFEIQITSILRHAWSEMEHGWYDLKDSFPPKVKRRYARLAALLEIAEAEFVELRKLKKQMEGSASARVKAEMRNIPIDSASLKAFIEQDRLLRLIDIRLATGILGGEIANATSDYAVGMTVGLLNAAGIRTIEELRESLGANSTAVADYVRQSRDLIVGSLAGNLQRTGATYESGIALFHLAMMLIAASGLPRLQEVTRSLRMPAVQLETLRDQVATAKLALNLPLE